MPGVFSCTPQSIVQRLMSKMDDILVERGVRCKRGKKRSKARKLVCKRSCLLSSTSSPSSGVSLPSILPLSSVKKRQHQGEDHNEDENLKYDSHGGYLDAFLWESDDESDDESDKQWVALMAAKKAGKVDEHHLDEWAEEETDGDREFDERKDLDKGAACSTPLRIYALDCEMVQVTRGTILHQGAERPVLCDALARCSVVDANGIPVLDEFVMPKYRSVLLLCKCLIEVLECVFIFLFVCVYMCIY